MIKISRRAAIGFKRLGHGLQTRPIGRPTPLFKRSAGHIPAFHQRQQSVVHGHQGLASAGGIQRQFLGQEGKHLIARRPVEPERQLGPKHPKGCLEVRPPP